MGYIGNQSAGITYTNINTFRGKVANLTALSAVSGMMSGDLYLTEDNNHAHMYTGIAWVDLGTLTGPQGSVGPKGIAGASVSTVLRTTGNGSPGTTDIYTITYTDATTSTFSVYNGGNGMPGTINHIKRTVGTGAAGTTDTYTAYADAAETQLLGTFNVYNGKDGIVTLNDSTTTNTTVWSSQKVQDELDNLDALPIQTGNDGKFLSTNGITANWTGLPATTTPIVSISSSVNEGTMANGTITNYDSDATYTFTATNGAITYSGGNEFVYTAPDVTDGNADVDRLSVYATKAGELRSNITKTTITVVFVPIMADDTIQVVDFTGEASFNDGFDII